MNVNDVFQQGNNYTIDNPKYKKVVEKNLRLFKQIISLKLL